MSFVTKVVYDLIGFIVAYYQSIYALRVLSLAWWNHAIISVIMKITATPHERHDISDHQQPNCLFSSSFGPITKISKLRIICSLIGPVMRLHMMTSLWITLVNESHNFTKTVVQGSFCVFTQKYVVISTVFLCYKSWNLEISQWVTALQWNAKLLS